MRTIVTLTLNPALDVATAAEALVHERKLRCEPPLYDPGGGGINVARVVQRLGGTACALYACGGPNGAALQGLLGREGIRHQPLPIAGDTRQSFMVHERSTLHRFRFVLPGPSLREDEWQGALDAFGRAAAEADFAIGSGSLPPGVPVDFYARAARAVRRAGARFVVDTSGEALAAALEEGVYLAKPNRDEIAELAGEELQWPEGIRPFAATLVERGAAEVLVVSRGEQGALLTAKGISEVIPAPKVDVVSSVGAGDSFLAGMCLGLARGWPLQEACRFAAAAAGGTLLTPGTELCRPEDVERLFREIGGGAGPKAAHSA